MLLASTIRLLAFVLGAAQCVFLAALFARKRSAGTADRVASAALLAACVWQATSAITIFHRASAGRPDAVLLSGLDHLGTAALAVIPVLVLNLVMAWSAVRPAFITAVYLAVPTAWWALESGRTTFYGAWIATAFAVSSAVCAYAAWKAGLPPIPRRFLAAFAVTLFAVPAVGIGAGPDSAAFPVVCLGPPFAVTWWIYRYNLFALLIRPRLVFALKMGVAFALYLLIIKGLAGIVQEEFEGFGPLVELALAFAAALVWLPLYGWMSRFLAQRVTVYGAFSKRLIEDAARILDFAARVQFLAEEVGCTFGLHRALLVTGGDPPLTGYFGPPDTLKADTGQWSNLFQAVRAHRGDMVSAAGAGDPEIRSQLSGTGFNYLFALWYEDRLNGLLLLDTAPRLFLDLDESILTGLSGQISHSLETGRVIEEKIELERQLGRQEHLAALGRAAAAMAHEVRNPLSSIKTLTQLLREDPDVHNRYSRDLGFILGEVDRLNRTVQQLLSFSRPVTVREEEVGLSELLEATAGVLAREYASAEIRIEHSIAPRLTMRRASTEALQQVVLNLLLNAIQSSKPGSAVKLEASRGGNGKIVIAVTDQGAGIPPEIRARIFEPFFTTRHKGTGLGLAIVRKNVEEMSGVIDVESPVSGTSGTRMTVALPCG